MIRVVIVDDEPPARAKLRKLLAGEEGFEVVGDASDGDEAVRAIRELRPDAVFLDIQMPKRDGFGVIDEIGAGTMPPVVFVTAYDEHALRAFEVNAIDYLLKPFAATRFRRVLDKLRKQCEGPRDELARQMQALLESVSIPARFLRRIVARKDADREVFLDVERIDVIRADRNYLRFVTAGGELFKRGTISEIEGQLDPDRFLRINRSEIVRLDAVVEVQPWFHGDSRVVMPDGRVLMWSRRYRKKGET